MTSIRSQLLRQALRWAALVIPVAGSLVAAQAGHATPPSGQGTATADHHPTVCVDTSVTPTVEESRLVTPLPDGHPSVGAQILTASGLPDFAGDLRGALCHARSLRSARDAVSSRGQSLWGLATARAQGRVHVAGTLAGNDDRPLYWARLSMTLVLRQWQPAFHVGAADRAGLQLLLERASRGMLTTAFRGRPGEHRVFVSGFDPFSLDADARQGNPSGANALALDGRVWTTKQDQTFEVQTVVFPVRYADFDQGMVEDVFRPVFTPGTDHTAEEYATVSQGRPGAFDVELYNGRRRSTTAPDNNDLQGGGTFTAPVTFPNVGAGPEFVPTTLPTAQIFMNATGAFPVRLNSAVVDMPAGTTTPTREPNGPTRDSIAVQGTGGGYLSNEVAYRASLLRDTVGATFPRDRVAFGGHIHTPVLDFGPGNTGQVTDPVFEQNRTAMIDELRTMIEAMPLR